MKQGAAWAALILLGLITSTNINKYRKQLSISSYHLPTLGAGLEAQPGLGQRGDAAAPVCSH